MWPSVHADGMRDYLKWHDAYDDPTSDLSWRLGQVQAYIRRNAGPDPRAGQSAEPLRGRWS